MRLSILCVFAAALCTQCFAQTTTTPDSQNLPSIPVIVAKKQFVNQVGSIDPFILYTANEDVVLIAYGYISTPSCPVGGIVGSALILWTDDYESSESSIALLDCPTGGAPIIGSGSQIIHAKAGTPIRMDISANAATTFNLYIVLERL